MSTASVRRSGLFSGMGFAIPASTLRPVLAQLVEHGRVRRGYLGVSVESDRAGQRSSAHVGTGVVIGDVHPGGPAERAGIQRGDVVTTLDGEPLGSAAQLRHRLALLVPGSEVHMRLDRQGRLLDVVATLDDLPDSGGAEPAGARPTHGSACGRRLYSGGRAVE
jgi:S1-C subfamily serine protease